MKKLAQVNTEGANVAGTIAAGTIADGTSGAGRGAGNGAPVRVQGSAEDLRTAVLNVLDNAIKYSGENVDVRVRLEAPDEKRVVLSVQDQGVGISADDVKLIFRRFYRVTPSFARACERNGSGIVYREGDCGKTWRQSICRKRRRRPGHDRDAATAANASRGPAA